MKMLEFFAVVYKLIGKIPRGSVTTYGDIAAALGSPLCSRRVAQALANTPPGLDIPCHRVVNAAGRTAPGWAEQKLLLLNEGIPFKQNGCVDLNQCRWHIDAGMTGEI